MSDWLQIFCYSSWLHPGRILKDLRCCPCWVQFSIGVKKKERRRDYKELDLIRRITIRVQFGQVVGEETAQSWRRPMRLKWVIYNQFKCGWILMVSVVLPSMGWVLVERGERYRSAISNTIYYNVIAAWKPNTESLDCQTTTDTTFDVNRISCISYAEQYTGFDRWKGQRASEGLVCRYWRCGLELPCLCQFTEDGLINYR